MNTRPIWLPALLLLLPGCPDFRIVCREGTARCGAGCADFASDRANCGTCGLACGNGEVCSEGKCQCGPGTTACDGACAVLDTDPQNCGACGMACAPGQVCEAKACREGCTAGVSLRCGDRCVDAQRDVSNCGGCGVMCGSGQSCRAGACTYDVIAACFTSGQVTGLHAESGVRGPLAPLGTGPAALALYESTLLAADGIDRRLHQALAKGPQSEGLPLYARAVRTGQAPNQVVVDAPFVYLVNATSGTLQVLERAAGDAGVVTLPMGMPGGLPLITVAELSFGDNTFPEGIAKVGGTLFVPLYGGYGAGPAAAGQKLAVVNVTQPRAPSEVARIDLQGLDLKPFDGGQPVARPYAAVLHRGQVVVVLNNLNPDTYAPEGPGLLLKVDPASRALSTVDLGAERCLNPVWLQSDGTTLFVSCAGAPVYTGPPDYALVASERGGVLALDEQDQVVAQWTAGCPADAGLLVDGGPRCPPVLPGRFTLRDGRVFLGDQNAGRVFVLGFADGGLVEERGERVAAGPIQACVRNELTGVANVADLVSVP